jgi:alanyl-tRNA synthetase
VLGMVDIAAADISSARLAVLVEQTPFHPLDHQWPDQPGDIGTIEIDGQILDIVDSIVGAAPDGSTEVFAGSDIPVRRGEPGWHWLVLHAISKNSPVMADGSTAILKVDADRRRRLSISHTACHLSGFAVNAILKESWRKEVPVDSLGNPDFDGMALTRSRITQDGFCDDYRIGRTLRKQGFQREDLDLLVGVLGEKASALVRSWTRTVGPIRIDCDGTRLCDHRTWQCQLPAGTARLACGGTHPENLGAIGDVVITATLGGEGTELHLTASVSPSDWVS